MANKIERLTIKGFAGIEHVSLDLSLITALIGPQASGKSVAAKLLYFFRSVWSDLLYAIDPDEDDADRKERVKQQFKRYFPVETWGSEMFTLIYEAGGHEVRLRRGPSKGKPSEGLILTVPGFVDELTADFNRRVLEKVARDPRTPVASSIRYQAWIEIEKELREKLGAHYYGSQIFVPAGRAFFSNIENNVFSFISRSEKKLDPFLTLFGEYYSYLKSGGIIRRTRGTQEYSSALVKGLLRGKFIVEKDREYVRADDGRVLPLANLSSGQQEALPLLLLLDRSSGVLNYGSDRRVATYIEEPEAHLFPDFQRLITQNIVQYVKSGEGAASVFITTHSPYVLSTINNLILAGKVAGSLREESRRGVSSIVSSSMWLDEGSVSAYSFSGDGDCESIIDIETGLIDAEYLDSVSTSIGKVFESLMDYYYKVKES